MGLHIFPPGLFFTDSPEVRIQCGDEHDDDLKAVLSEELGRVDKGTLMHWFLRPRTPEEARGHFIRMEGVKRMDNLVRQYKDGATLLHLSKVL